MNCATLLLIWTVLLSASAFAADKKNETDAARNTYVSETDRDLTVHKLSVLPVIDNVGGLYSRSVENKLNSIIKEGHRFELVELKDVNPLTSLQDYESNPELIKSMGRKYGTDGFIAAKISKSQKTADITLDFFVAKDGYPLAQEVLTNDARFTTADIERKASELFTKVVNKLPYKGLVLSRQGNRVTLDIGTTDGILNNTIVSVEQILSVKRHPKFKFVLSSEKEILGKIKIIKADETLSFGIILQEKERGVIGRDSKITGLDYVTYGNGEEESLQNTPQTPNDAVSFGKNPREWLPAKRPSVGMLGLALGLGGFHYAMSLQTAGSFSSDVPIYPQLDLHGEIWITPNWYLGALLRQGIFTMSNNMQNSTPSSLGATSSHYDLHAGYKFLLQDDFFGPQINIHFGFSKYSLFVDSTTPLAYTSTSYGGMYLGIGGSVPVSTDRTYYLDVNLTRHLFPIMTETPASSGATSDSSITTFSFGGSHKLTTQFWIQAHIDFEFYATNFSGVGTRNDTGASTSQSVTTLLSGIDYYF